MEGLFNLGIHQAEVSFSFSKMKGVFMFNVQDNIFYPGYGVAIIEEVIEKMVGEKSLKLFKLKFLYKETTILLPLDKIGSCGIRYLCNLDAINKIFKFFYLPPERKFEFLDFTPSGWNRRNKDYQLRLQSGKIDDVAHVYKELMNIAQQKELSFGEKKIVAVAEELLVQEIAVVSGHDSQSVLDQLHAPFKQFLYTQSNITQFSSAA